MKLSFLLVSLCSAFLFSDFDLPRNQNLLLEWGSAPSEPLQLKTSYRFMTWNIYKGGYDGLYSDYSRFVDEYDFIATQEFLLNVPQENLIEQKSLSHWALAKSFMDSGEWTGVATVSRWQPLVSVPAKSPGAEPFTGTPKMALISTYAIEDGRVLMIVNVHGLNFNLMHGAFKEQIDDLVEKMKEHQGPLIFAGDFNTWAETRLAHLLQRAKSLGLTRANLENPMGFYTTTLDHIFYRDVVMEEEKVLTNVETSDHLPMVLKFRFQ